VRKINLALVVGIVLAVLSGVIVIKVISQANRTVTVYVANQTLSARKQILPAYISVAHLRPEDVPPGTVTKYSDIVGHYTLTTIFADQTFVSGALASSVNPQAVVTNGLTPDERAFAVQADVAQALAGRIQSGDHVDIVVVVNASGSPGGSSGGGGAVSPAGQFAQTILTQVDVLAVEPSASVIEAAANSSSGTNPAQVAQKVTVPGIYTLALTPDEVQELALAENVGTLYLSLDPYGTVSPYSGVPTQIDSLSTTQQAPPVPSSNQPSNGGNPGRRVNPSGNGR
jgi:Flp pilus assembly protein CpaB